MALKNLFDMVKADRYTADGREAIIKAQEAETEDARRTYQIGEISEATGLQKTAQGWKPPKETKFGKVKQNKEGQWGVQTKQGKGSDFLKHKSEKEASRALANYTAGYNTTERSKQDPHSDQARQVKQWRKEDEKAAKARRAEGRAAHAAQFQKPAAESKSEEETKTETTPKTPKPSVQEYMKAKDRVKKYEEQYKKEMDDYEYMERIKANGVDTSIFNPMYGGKPKPLTENKSYMEELGKIKAFEAKDSAPRVLTGDTRIHVRKA